MKRRVDAGFGSVAACYNRIDRTRTGPETMRFQNPDRLPTDPVDNTLGVVRITDTAGNLRAVLANYACHAVVLGPETTEISADYTWCLA